MSSQPRMTPNPDKPDVMALMARIRREVEATLATPRPTFKPGAPSFDSGKEVRAGELLHSDDLRSINHLHTYSLALGADAIRSHRTGLVGKLIVKVKGKVLHILRHSLLRDYFEREHQFHASLTRYLNAMTKYVDARDASNFWELVHKIDVDTTKAMDRVERFADESSGTVRSVQRELGETLHSGLRSLSDRIAALESQAGQMSAATLQLDGVVKGLEALAAQPKTMTKPAETSSAVSEPIDRTYILFENRFRGSEAEIASRLAPYVDLFKTAPGKVLEIGSGRGELQRLFKAAGVDSYGVDTDAAMVESARAAGATVLLEDCVQHLEKCQPESLGGIIAVQVIEHLPHGVMRRLLELAHRALKPNGILIFETINPQSMLALSSNYFRDPTHVFPQHPDTVKYLLELFGFSDVNIRYQSPVPEGALLPKLPHDSALPPRWALTIDQLNSTITRLNDLLFGFQDYAVIGRKAVEAQR